MQKPDARAPAETSVLRGCRATVIGLAPLFLLIALYAFRIPLGQPHFVLRYSSMLPSRLGRAGVGLLIGLVGVAALYHWLRCAKGAPLARVWAGASITLYVALVFWTFFAPPAYVAQHSFNLLSPSHEGAFVVEARSVTSIRDYVSSTFYERLGKTPEEMRGRRVLSNPPGMTVLSVLMNRLVRGAEALRSVLVSSFGLGELDDFDQQTEFAAAMLLALLMTALWGASLAFGYGLCRLWLPPAAAATIAFCSVFNPATVNYTPGKDCVQLLTTLAVLYFWSKALLHKQARPAVMAGMAFVISLLVGLVHVWIVVIIMAATLWDALRRGEGPRSAWRHCLLFFLMGAAGLSLAFYGTVGWNVLSTTYRIAVRYNEIQLPIITEPFHWTLVGLPLFLLFAGPCFWVEATGVRRDLHDAPAALGGAVLVATGLAMLYSYFFANNSETVRLWIPFIPLLQWGMALRRSPFRDDDPHARAFCLKLLVLQLAVTLVQWSVMDVRESEWRLLSGRMWS